MKKINYLVWLMVSLMSCGCASILDGGPKLVQINSKPPGATVAIFDKTGKNISVVTTPATIALKRNHGPYRGEDYKLVFNETGYCPYETHVKSTIDGWYFGNIVFGGLLGMIIIDPMTGDCFTLSPREISYNLVPLAGPGNQAGAAPTAAVEPGKK